MLKVTEIAFSCYPVTDMARARAFYEGVLGFEVRRPAALGDDSRSRRQLDLHPQAEGEVID